MKTRHMLRFGTSLLSLVGVLAASSAIGAGQARTPDVTYVATPQRVVDEMLRLAKVTAADVVYDLGCGDGRIVITAATRYGARGVGVDIDPARVRESTANAKAAGVSEKVRFVTQDLFDTDLRDATVVALYLLPSLNDRLKPKLLKELRPGSRIVSNSFAMTAWEPTRTVTIDDRVVYLWTIPLR